MLGTCRLCLTQANLRESHIIPAWVYKRSRTPTRHPVVAVRDGVVMESSKQVTDSLLCTPCEQRIGAVENRISQIVYQADGSAPFLDLVGNALHFDDNGGRLCLPGKLPTEDLIFFGVSVVWRASISSKVPSCRLGADHEEAFRQFLLGAPFPPDASCLTCFYDLPMETGEHIASICYFPWTAEGDDCSVHEFTVFGLGFALATGNVSAEVRKACTHASQDHWILLARQDVLLESAFAIFMRNARRVGKLARKQR